ncbi:MAG: hypothetical protein NTZ97_01350 [Candidatus Moranbacteria bacterium]|nr:hypothetical protein [Candidatus Moranbacteria bacterium]
MLKSNKFLAIELIFTAVLAGLAVFHDLQPALAKNSEISLEASPKSVQKVPACNLESEAWNFVEQIYLASPDHFSVRKPYIVYLREEDKNDRQGVTLGESDGQKIYIYEKGLDKLYGQNCSSEKDEMLKNTINHEYIHHIAFNLKNFKNRSGIADDEKLAVIGGEYALAQMVWKQANASADKIDPQDFDKIYQLENILSAL